MHCGNFPTHEKSDVAKEYSCGHHWASGITGIQVINLAYHSLARISSTPECCLVDSPCPIT